MVYDIRNNGPWIKITILSEDEEPRTTSNVHISEFTRGMWGLERYYIRDEETFVWAITIKHSSVAEIEDIMDLEHRGRSSFLLILGSEPVSSEQGPGEALLGYYEDLEKAVSNAYAETYKR